MKTTTEMDLTPIQTRKIEACILSTLRFARIGSGKEWELTQLEVNQMENLSSTEVIIEVCSTDKPYPIRYNYQGFVSRRGAIMSYDHNKKKMLCGRKALNNVSIGHW